MRNLSVHFFIILLTASGLFLSCSKSSKPDVFSYTVNGVQDFTMYRDSAVDIPLSVILNSGISEEVTITISGFKPGIEATSTILKGFPPFTGTFRLYDRGAIEGYTALGTYPINVNATSVSTESKTYSFNLNYKMPSDCGGLLHGTYSAIGDTHPSNYNSTITRAGANSILIHDFYADYSFYPISAKVYCTSNTLTIVHQQINSITAVSGYGTFTDHNIYLNYNIINEINGDISSTHTVTFSR